MLFQNRYLAVIDRDGYVFYREVRCDGKIVALLPFRTVENQLEFLDRLEKCPAHGPELELCSITGGVEPKETIKETALHELWEEAGFRVNGDDLIGLGQVHPSKSADTTVYLFGIDVGVGGKLHSTPKGDGTKLEKSASVEWLDYKQGLHVDDPLFVTMMMRLLNLLKEKRDGTTGHQSQKS